MPDIVLVGIKADTPAENYGLKPPLVDKFIYKRGPFKNPYIHFNPNLLQPPLDDRSGVYPQIFPMFVRMVNSKGLPFLSSMPSPSVSFHRPP